MHNEYKNSSVVMIIYVLCKEYFVTHRLLLNKNKIKYVNFQGKKQVLHSGPPVAIDILL